MALFNYTVKLRDGQTYEVKDGVFLEIKAGQITFVDPTSYHVVGTFELDGQAAERLQWERGKTLDLADIESIEYDPVSHEANSLYEIGHDV